MKSAVISRLTSELGYPEVTPDTLTEYLGQPGLLVLFFAGDVNRYPEAADVAVILPELVAAFPERLSAVVVKASYEQQLKRKYPFQHWPSLVFLRAGVQVGAISKVKSWAEYLQLIESMLANKSTADGTIAAVQV